MKAWQAVDEHVATLNKIGGLVGQFGPTSSSLPLIERPAELYSASVDDRSLMLTEFELGRASFIFRSTNGLHRKSPWFSPHPCSINTIAESRERMRAFAEDAWIAEYATQGKRGRITDDGWIEEVRVNPYAKKPVPTA